MGNCNCWIKEWENQWHSHDIRDSHLGISKYKYFDKIQGIPTPSTIKKTKLQTSNECYRSKQKFQKPSTNAKSSSFIELSDLQQQYKRRGQHIQIQQRTQWTWRAAYLLIAVHFKNAGLCSFFLHLVWSRRNATSLTSVVMASLY